MLKFVRIEWKGKAYDVKLEGEKGQVWVLTKRGRRQLTGFAHQGTREHIVALAKLEN